MQSEPHLGLMNEPQSIMPWPVVQCLCQLDNIYEVRLFGWVLAKAQSVLKLYNKDLSDINIEHAMRLTRVTIPTRYILSYNDKNYSNVRKAFTLADKKLTWVHDNRELYLTIIALPEIIKDEGRSRVTFVIHNDLWHALLDFGKGYRLFSMSSLMSLSSPYSVILYLLVSNQKGPMTLTLAYLKRLLGVEHKRSYDRGNNFFGRIIDPARAELDAKTPYTFEYTAERTGRGGSYTSMVLVPKLSSRYQKQIKSDGTVTLVLRLRSRLDDGVIEYLKDSFDLQESSLEAVEKLIPASWTPAQILDHAARIKSNLKARRVKNKAGYYINSLKHI